MLVTLAGVESGGVPPRPPKGSTTNEGISENQFKISENSKIILFGSLMAD